MNRNPWILHLFIELSTAGDNHVDNLRRPPKIISFIPGTQLIGVYGDISLDNLCTDLCITASATAYLNLPEHYGIFPHSCTQQIPIGWPSFGSLMHISHALLQSSTKDFLNW